MLDGRCGVCNRQVMDHEDNYGTESHVLCVACKMGEMDKQQEALLKHLNSIKPTHKTDDNLTPDQHGQLLAKLFNAGLDDPLSYGQVDRLAELVANLLVTVLRCPIPIHKTDDELAALLATAPKERSKWRHYKRNDLYYVLGAAIHENTGEVMVVYNKWNHGIIFTRPLGQWQEIVEHGGERVPRYVEVE